MKVSLTDFKKLYAQEYDLQNVNVQFYKLEDIKKSPMVYDVLSLNEAIATMKKSKAFDWELFTRTCLGSEKYYESFDSWDGKKIKYLDLKDVIRVDTKAEIDYVYTGSQYEMSYLKLFLGTFDKENWFIFDVAHFSECQFNQNVLKHCNIKVSSTWSDSMKIYKNQPADITKYIEQYALRYADKVKSGMQEEQDELKQEKVLRIKFLTLQNTLAAELTDVDKIRYVKDTFSVEDSHLELTFNLNKDTNIEFGIWTKEEWSAQFKKDIRLYCIHYDCLGTYEGDEETEYEFLESETNEMIYFIKEIVKMIKFKEKYTEDATARYKE